MATGYPDYTLELPGAVQVAQGGTGLGSVPSWALVAGNYTLPLQVIPPIAMDGAPLQCSGGTWSAGDGVAGALTIPITPYVEPGGIVMIARYYDHTGEYCWIEWQDWQGVVAGSGIGVAVSAAQMVSTSQAGDLVIDGGGRILLAQGASGPQLVLDSGGVHLPAVESVNGLATVGQGVPVILAIVHGEAVAANSAVLTLLASAPAGIYRVSASFAINAIGTRTGASIGVSFTDLSGVAQVCYVANSAYYTPLFSAGETYTGSLTLNAKAAANITTQFGVAGGAGGSFDYVVVLERLS